MQYTFWVSFEIEFEPKMSFPEVWREETGPLEFLLPFAESDLGSLDVVPAETKGGVCCFKGLPSNRLPVPVKGLNLGISGSASDSAEIIKKVKMQLNQQ